MREDVDLGRLEHGPHAASIRRMAESCYADPMIQAIWVGGSLAAGTGDAYSDIDFRIAVEPGELERWRHPDWTHYLPEPLCGASFLPFDAHAFLHHLVLADGTIVDFYVQDTSREHFEPALVVIACRNAPFGDALARFESPAASLTRAIDSERLRQFLVDYWIATHKEAKGLGRKYDASHFAGLYVERMALLRAWYMESTGQDIEARVSIHMLGAVNKGLQGRLSEQQHSLLGLPSTTVEETVSAIEAIRTEMARVGRLLSRRYGFHYPGELEEVVLRTWRDHKAELTRR